MDTQAKFEGWAVIELFGHQREAGFVTTQYFGNAAMFQLDVPELPEREWVLERPDWVNNQLAPKGSKVRKEAKPGRSRLINPSAVYALNPATEEAVCKALDNGSREIKLVELPESKQIGAGENAEEYEEEDDRSEMEPTDEELEEIP
jgi:hypothetical protein